MKVTLIVDGPRVASLGKFRIDMVFMSEEIEAPEKE
tara:strand:- start:122593 stop:122700 length:108 start_codon:yes stop_codon:yes gene_type:complete